MTDPLKHYDRLIEHAVEEIANIATRYGINSRHLMIAIDVGREPARYNEHTVTLSIRDSDIAVTAESIPHDWFRMGTGFVDTRLSRRIGPLLLQLLHKAHAAGRSLD